MKKILAAILVIAMVLSCLCIQAFAQGYGSVEADNMTTTSDKPDWYEDEKTAIQDFVVDNHFPVIDYFGEEVKAAAQKLLPINVELLETAGFAGCGLEGETPDGPTKLTFSFNPELPDTDLALTILGLQGENGIDWTPIKAIVTGGKLIATVPADVTAKLNGNSIMAVCASVSGPPTTGDEPSDQPTPSKGSHNMYDVDPSGDAEGEDGLVLRIGEPDMPWALEELQKLGAADPAVSYFGEAVKAAVAEKAADPDALIALEAVYVDVDGYKMSMGKYTADLRFPTTFGDDQNTVAILGFSDGETVTWAVMEAETDEGAVKATFTIDQMMRLDAEKGLLIMLRDPAV